MFAASAGRPRYWLSKQALVRLLSVHQSEDATAEPWRCGWTGAAHRKKQQDCVMEEPPHQVGWKMGGSQLIVMFNEYDEWLV